MVPEVFAWLVFGMIGNRYGPIIARHGAGAGQHSREPATSRWLDAAEDLHSRVPAEARSAVRVFHA